MTAQFYEIVNYVLLLIVLVLLFALRKAKKQARLLKRKFDIALQRGDKLQMQARESRRLYNGLVDEIKKKAKEQK